MIRITLSHGFVTYDRSPEVSSTAFRATPPNLRFASLMEMGFAKPGPLAQRSRLRSGSCTLARVFAPRFLQTPPRGDALALRYHFTYQVVKRTYTSKLSNMRGAQMWGGGEQVAPTPSHIRRLCERPPG